MFFEQSKGTSKKFRAKLELVAAERESIAFELMTFEELHSATGEEFIYDVECYINYFLVVFRSVKTKKICYLEMHEDAKLDVDLLSYIMWHVCTIGFNNNKYDSIMVAAAISGMDCNQLKQLSDAIIKDGMRGEQLSEDLCFKLLRGINTYDLYEVAPLTDSLKKYAARMHAKRMQELPYHEAAILKPDEKIKVREYCFVDTDNTDLLRNELVKQIELRVAISRMYGGVDLRSKSDAQIAEAVIVSELTKLKGYRPKKPDFDLNYSFHYKPPAYIQFQTPELQNMLEKLKGLWFTLRANGSPQCEELTGNKETGRPPMSVNIGGRKYRMGIGGLHSAEQAQTVVVSPQWGLYDTDFESFYPKLILNNEWYPKHLNYDFLTVFRKIVERRLKAKGAAAIAKAQKDLDAVMAWLVEADSLKITINGSFGKLGSVFSLLYSPDLLVQTTVTGQLTLLMLIEACELVGIKVISANTDGFVVHLHDSQRAQFDAIVKGFEAYTNLKTEETSYNAIYSRDVNNYIAIKSDGEVKVKGVFSEKGSTGNTRLSKNPEGLIVADAVVAYLTKKIPIVQTIRNCQDIRRFVCVKNVKGGGHQNGLYLGKTVRWIYGKGSKDTINYVDSGNAVGDSYGAFPMMDLPDEFPANLDHDRYISDALKALVEIGFTKQAGNLF